MSATVTHLGVLRCRHCSKPADQCTCKATHAAKACWCQRDRRPIVVEAEPTELVTAEEIDVALDWMRTHCHWFSVKVFPRWSIAVLVERPGEADRGQPPRSFVGDRFTDALGAALAWLVAERARRGIRGGDS